MQGPTRAAGAARPRRGHVSLGIAALLVALPVGARAAGDPATPSEAAELQAPIPLGFGAEGPEATIAPTEDAAVVVDDDARIDSEESAPRGLFFEETGEIGDAAPSAVPDDRMPTASAQKKGKKEKGEKKKKKRGKKKRGKKKKGKKGKKDGDDEAAGEEKGEEVGDEGGEDEAAGEPGEEGPHHGKPDHAGSPKGPDPEKRKQMGRERAKHIKRMAKIARIEELAKEKENEALIEKVKALREKETRRHQRKMAKLTGAPPPEPAPATDEDKAGDGDKDKKKKKKKKRKKRSKKRSRRSKSHDE